MERNNEAGGGMSEQKHGKEQWNRRSDKAEGVVK
jgi:hypothetical protein